MEVFVNIKEKRSWLEVNLNQILANYTIYKRQLPIDTSVMIVTKADAYGHGDVRVAWKLIQAGINFIAVSNIDEAIVLRDAGVECEILILGYTSPKHAKTLYNDDITQAILSKEYAYALIETGYPVKCHLALDTGMGRIGIRATELKDCEMFIRDIYIKLNLTGLFTHLCVADSTLYEDVVFTREQLLKFKRVVECVKDLKLPFIHCYNSSAGLAYCNTEYKYISKIVRVGVLLYGLKPSNDVIIPKGIKPAITWKTVVSMVKDMEPGDTIGYGRTYKVDRPMRVATIPTGYADGYNRLLSNKGFVLIHGKKAPILGNICMDQMMVDVTNIPEAEMATEVVLLGRSGNIEYTADDMAEAIGSIGYEVMCDISKRVQRYYK